MTEKFKILGRYIKDLSSETPNIETYLYVKENISKYNLGIDINSKALKNQLIEIDIRFKFEDKTEDVKKSYFEIVFATVIKVDKDIKEKKDLEKIVLCEVPNKIYPELEKALLDLLHNSGYPSIKFDKKVNFEELYNKKFN
tara:strand:+ start:40 stop:462 length:423 start_codon:yes stop_codon:yes gene_type:complete